MQLSALNENGDLVTARSAHRQHDYRCIECQGVVRLRGGRYRQPHFYHLAATVTCRLNGKSLKHLNLQLYLEKILPFGEVVLEKAFPEIQRIADVFWMSQRIVFEVQCSLTTAEEVAARNRDYASIGCQVVWILHDSCFNQKRQTAVEFFLQSQWLYYTNMDREGRGSIYDQLSFYKNGKKYGQALLSVVDLSKISLISGGAREFEQSLPDFFKRKMLLPFCFEGDFVHKLLNDPQNSLLIKMFSAKLPNSLRKRRPILRFFLDMYRIFLRELLEKLCR